MGIDRFINALQRQHTISIIASTTDPLLEYFSSNSQVVSAILCNCPIDKPELGCRAVRVLMGGSEHAEQCNCFDKCPIRERAADPLAPTKFTLTEDDASLLFRAAFAREQPPRQLKGHMVSLSVPQELPPGVGRFFLSVFVDQDACPREFPTDQFDEWLDRTTSMIEGFVLINILSKLKFHGAPSLHRVFDRSNDPIIVINSDRVIKYKNSATTASVLMRYGIAQTKSGKFAFTSNATMQQFDRLFEGVFDKKAEIACCRLPAKGDNPSALLIMLQLDAVDPARDPWGWLFDGDPLVMLAIREDLPKKTLSVPMLKTAFELTPKEAELLAALVSGHSLESYARQTNISRETARWHLRHILQKSQCRNQSNLIRRVLYQLMIIAPF